MAVAVNAARQQQAAARVDVVAGRLERPAEVGDDPGADAEVALDDAAIGDDAGVAYRQVGRGGRG